MDLVTINAAIASAKAAATTLSALLKLKLDHETLVIVNEACQQLADVQQQLFSTNEQLFTLQRERDDLQKRLESIEEWEKNKAAYKLVETEAGAFIWESVESSPKHYACPVCITDKKLVPMSKRGDYLVACPACNKTFQVRKSPPTQPLVRQTVRFGSGSW
jgi:hypothetical protein